MLGQRCGRDPRAQVLDLVAFAFAKLLLNRLHLLAQVVLLLRVGHLLLRLRLDLALELEHRDFARQQRVHQLELLRQRIGFEQLLFLLGLEIEHRPEQVRQPHRVVDAGHQLPHFGRETRGQRERAIDELLDAPDVGVDFDALVDLLGCERQLRPQHARFRQRPMSHARARHAFDDDVQPLWTARHLPDDADGADVVQFSDASGSSSSPFCKQQQDQPIAGERGVDRFDRHRAVDGQRLQRQRERRRCAGAEGPAARTGTRQGGTVRPWVRRLLIGTRATARVHQIIRRGRQDLLRSLGWAGPAIRVIFRGFRPFQLDVRPQGA